MFLPVDQLVGVSIVAVIASAGVLGLAIGFSAQSVVEDLLRGLFMLAEDQFGVGDRVDAVIIRVVCVEAGERRTFERELRRRLKADLDAAGIEMPNRQVDIWLRDQAQAA